MDWGVSDLILFGPEGLIGLEV